MRFISPIVSLRAGIVVLFFLLLNQSALSQGEDSQVYAEMQPLAAKSLLLAVEKAGDQWLAVGERGHILKSGDGKDWVQLSQVPTLSTLTSMAAVGQRIWAAGHDSVILASGDGGDSWTVQYQEDGGDPILDLLFLDADNGFAIGAYGRLMVTADGGENWDFQDLNESLTGSLFDAESLVLGAGNDYAAQFADLGCYEFLECHLNHILNLGEQRLLILAERGFGFRSSDLGQTWEAYRLPYEGSMFGGVQLDQQCVLAFGLRGNAFRSCDFAESWQAVNTQTEYSLLGGVVDGSRVLLAGSSGAIVSGGLSDDSLALTLHPSGVDFSTIATTASGSYLLLGEDGVHHFPLAAGGSEHD